MRAAGKSKGCNLNLNWFRFKFQTNSSETGHQTFGVVCLLIWSKSQKVTEAATELAQEVSERR